MIEFNNIKENLKIVKKMKSGESKGGKSVFGTHNPLLIWSVTEQTFIWLVSK